MKHEISSLDATDQARLVAAGEITALELLDATIARIEELEPSVGALSTVDFDRARDRAKAKLEGPFGGVPFLLKDLIAYPGLRHTMGSRLFAQNIPADPTPYSAAIDRAGLNVLGKTTTSEMGLLGSTETLLDGLTHNPWNLDRSAGGSSGGSAAAVACRMVPMAHASDGGGSIRIPASLNGVFGFKPTGRRLVPSGPDDMQGLLVDHCVSWSVRDSARLLSLTERSDGKLAPVGYIDRPLSNRIRIGAYRQTLVGQPPAPNAESVLDRTIGLCRELGHHVDEIDAPPIDGEALGDAFFTLAGAGLDMVSNMVRPMLGREPGDQELEPFSLELRDWFRSLPAEAAPRAMETIATIAAAGRTFLEGYDVVLCPTVPVDTFALGTLSPRLDRETILERTKQLAGYTPLYNMVQAPAMSVPLFECDGMPLGSHFAASPGEEATLLSLAYELEQAAPWQDRWCRNPS